MRVLLSVFLAFCCLGSAANAQDRRPYTVDDMLRVESIGRIQFDPSGERLVFERFGPFDEQSDYGRQFVIGELRSKIHVVDLTQEGRPEPLFPQATGDGYTITGMSPDGSLLSFRHASEAGLEVGVVPVAGGTTTRFDFSPTYNPALALSWVGRGVILSAGRPGEVDYAAALGHERVETLTALWAQRNRGDAPTASPVGSGRFASLPDPQDSLVLAQAGNAQVRRLTAGRFSTWYASADGSAVAALREQRLTIDPSRRIEHGANIGGIERRLLIFDPRAPENSSPRRVCPDCDILQTSLNWSAAAPQLSFVARRAIEDWSGARYYIYDHRAGHSRAVELGGLKPHATRIGASISISSVWLGNRLAVFAEQLGAPVNAQGETRADWYLTGDGAPRNLTASFAGDAPDLVGLGRDSLVVLHGGDAWRIDAAGNRRNLTADIPERVVAWREPGPFSLFGVGNRQPSDTLILNVDAQGGDGADRLYFVNIATGRIDTLTAPSATSEFLAVSATARRAAVADRVDNVTMLMVIGADGLRRELVRLNDHLRGVAGGTPVRIDHKGPSGDDRMSWILLPPGYQPGHPVPTVVNVYPGLVFRETWTRWRLDQVHALNDHILAARGYAILYPSIPVRYEQVPREPLIGLSDEVFAAVDAAIARGFAAPDRLALQGQSYGAYATGALVGLTNRFKAAIAQGGTYNLISYYGQIDVRSRLDLERTGLNLFASTLTETGQIGMGSPPWDDAERYLRNSPLMHVRDVSTPIMLFTGDQDYVSTTQTEEFFTALTRLNKDAVMVRYFGEDHVYNSPANIRDMWRRILEWYDLHLRPASH